MEKYWKLAGLLLFIIISLAACRSDKKDDDGKPLDTQALVSKAADELNNADSFRLNIQQVGPPPIVAEIADLTITFESAQAIFVSPDRTSATIQIGIDDVKEDVSVIAINDIQFINHWLLTTGEWCQARFANGFNPADLQSSERGIGDALLSIKDLELVGHEEIEGGIPVYHLKGNVETERVRAVTVGMISSEEGDSAIDIYIRKDDTSRLARLVVNEVDAEDDTSRIWTIDFAGYNQSYSVEEPQALPEGCLIS